MPTLDVSEVFTDLFCETVTVVRREESIGVLGRNVITPTYFPDVFASVQPKDTAIGGNIISREPDGSYRGSNLNVYTQFRLRSVSKGSDGVTIYQPDLIIWNGDMFQVSLTNDFSHYGAGYMHAECEAVEMIDFAPGEGDA